MEKGVDECLQIHRSCQSNLNAPYKESEQELTVYFCRKMLPAARLNQGRAVCILTVESEKPVLERQESVSEDCITAA